MSDENPMHELDIYERDLKHIYDEVFDGREYPDIPKEELWKYLEDILELVERMIVVMRVDHERIGILERVQSAPLLSIRDSLLEDE